MIAIEAPSFDAGGGNRFLLGLSSEEEQIL
jgi:hypothetical protein